MAACARGGAATKSRGGTARRRGLGAPVQAARVGARAGAHNCAALGSSRCARTHARRRRGAATRRRHGGTKAHRRARRLDSHITCREKKRGSSPGKERGELEAARRWIGDGLEWASADEAMGWLRSCTKGKGARK